MSTGGIIRDYQNYQPKAWWSPEDENAIGLTRSRLAESATESGRGARLLAARRMVARGTGGSPASEATYARIAEGTALGRQRAGEAAEGQRYNIRLGRERMDFSRAGDIFRAKMQEDYQQKQREASFWNSTIGLVGAGVGFFMGGPAGSAAGYELGKQGDLYGDVENYG